MGRDPDAFLALLEVHDPAKAVRPDALVPGVLVEQRALALEPVEQEVGPRREVLAVEVAADPVLAGERAEERHPPALDVGIGALDEADWIKRFHHVLVSSAALVHRVVAGPHRGHVGGRLGHAVASWGLGHQVAAHRLFGLGHGWHVS